VHLGRTNVSFAISRQEFPKTSKPPPSLSRSTTATSPVTGYKFDSSPDYFGADGPVPATARGGQPGILSRFCQAGVSEDDLSQILGAGMVFTEEMLDQLCNEETSAAATEALARDHVPAEDLIAQLAEKMGISPARAVADYRGGIPEGD
jgi:hypothetical protein